MYSWGSIFNVLVFSLPFWLELVKRFNVFKGYFFLFLFWITLSSRDDSLFSFFQSFLSVMSFFYRIKWYPLYTWRHLLTCLGNNILLSIYFRWVKDHVLSSIFSCTTFHNPKIHYRWSLLQCELAIYSMEFVLIVSPKQFPSRICEKYYINCILIRARNYYFRIQGVILKPNSQ